MNDKKKENVFQKFGHSLKSLFSGGFFGRKQLNVLEEEEIQSPSKVIMKNFLHNHLAQIGIIGFLFIFSFTFIGSMFFPMDPLYTEPLLQDIKPGRGYLNYDEDLNKAGVKDIQSGATFTIALDKDGKVYSWGQNLEGALDIPSEVADETIAKIAVGDRHALALTENGDIIGWGYNNFNQDQLPFEVKNRLFDQKIVDIFAGDKYSAVLTDQQKLYVWGSTMTNHLDVVPEEYQGHIKEVRTSTYNMLLLLDDGRLVSLGVSGSPLTDNIPKKIASGDMKIKDYAMSFRNAVVLDDQGKIHVWGSTDNGLLNVPKMKEKIVSVAGAKNALYAVGESGKVYAWGSDALKETKVPADASGAKKVYASYFQMYAVNDDSKVIASWGNNGYLLGTDGTGRDVFIRLMHGGKVTLLVGVIAVLISAFIGVCIGMISGFKGGWLDNLLMRLTEIITSIPFMPLVITLSSFIGTQMSSDNKMYLIMVILGLLSWPPLARLVRSQILIEREKDFVLAARAMGIKEHSIVLRHILPNVVSMAIVDMTLNYAIMMLQEAALSFLGFGVQPPMPSWGNMLNAAQDSTVIQFYWWQWILPAVCVLIAALSVNLIGNALGDAIDPKANEK